MRTKKQETPNYKPVLAREQEARKKLGVYEAPAQKNLRETHIVTKHCPKFAEENNMTADFVQICPSKY